VTGRGACAVITGGAMAGAGGRATGTPGLAGRAATGAFITGGAMTGRAASGAPITGGAMTGVDGRAPGGIAGELAGRGAPAAGGGDITGGAPRGSMGRAPAAVTIGVNGRWLLVFAGAVT
jgi:hypothetical protein